MITFISKNINSNNTQMKNYLEGLLKTTSKTPPIEGNAFLFFIYNRSELWSDKP